MRIWSLHPHYLDRRGLVALWREGLLAQAVLRGKTKGYRHHPQLIRFREYGSPVASIASYLKQVQREATERDYQFDRSRIARAKQTDKKIPVTEGQLIYEWEHLCRKLRIRDKPWLKQLDQTGEIEPHPLFEVVEGDVEIWEKL